ncbi:B2L15 protein, partial [Pluvianellus socialis]|nr:B2L15 protein [Pluvianellus socialis]
AAMVTFEKQTEFIVEALFSDLTSEDESSCWSLETDSGGKAYSCETTFDPVVIASRLRRMGDRCNMDFERVSSKEVLAEVLNGKLPSRCLQMEKFGAAVETLSRSWSGQNPGLDYERVFLSVSVKLLMYVAKKIPAAVHPRHLIRVINGNPQVKNYIEAHGGWVRA